MHFSEGDAPLRDVDLIATSLGTGLFLANADAPAAAPAPAPAATNVGKLGVRDVLFGGRVSYVALAMLAIIALVIGLAGGWVGRKTAERLLVEMRDRLADWGAAEPVRPVGAPDSLGEAESALVALGYKPAEAARMLEAVRHEGGLADSAELIRAALRSVRR